MSDYRPYVGNQIVIQLDEHTIGGTLARETDQVLVLRDVALLDGEPMPMDGEVVVDRLRIVWVQAP